ncbi:unnamed protein product, partial [Ixodes hexagonus]
AGLDVELYYVKEGRRNEYALGFVVPVPANVSELEFVWQGLGPVPLAYALDVQVAEGKGHGALARPSLDVEPTGTLPSAPRTFRVRLPCTGHASAEVPVRIVLNVSQDNNATSVSVPRKKICARGEPWRRDVDGGGASGPAVAPPRRPLVVAAGCACAAVAAAALAATASWMVRARKARTALGYARARAGSHEPRSWTNCTLRQGFSNCGPRTPGEGSAVAFEGVHAELNNSKSPEDAQTQVKKKYKRKQARCLLYQKRGYSTFGQVHHGLLIEDWAEVGAEQNVIVKTVTREASAAQTSLLVREGMALAGMNHANVLAVVGAACDEPGPPLLLYPYMSGGNLKRFLRHADQVPKASSQFGPPTVLVTQDLVDMAIQVAEGLQYLHKRGFVHRDLGTRNCVVDDRLHVKLADSALSRDLFPDDYHCLGDGENRPVKWLALESLVRANFSAASDVWMYGVTLWELMTLAQQPYAELDPFEVAAHLSQGYRLGQPVNCPDPL